MLARGALIGWAVGVALAAPARAASTPAPAGLVDVSSMIGCPDAAEIAGWVTQTPAARARLEVAAPPGVTIVLAGATPTIEGVLFLRVGSERTERRVSGARCDEVARAVALVARLALEALPSAPPVKPEVALPAPVAAPEVPRLAIPWDGNAGGLVAVRGGAPEVALAAGAFVEVARGRLGLRLGVLATETSATSVMTVRGDLAWTLGTADVCGVFARIGGVRLAACGGLEAGTLRARGQGVGDPVTQTRPWVATGGDLRARFVAFGPIALELAGGARIPLIRDTFRFEPDVELHATPAVLAQVVANLSVSIW